MQFDNKINLNTVFMKCIAKKVEINRQTEYFAYNFYRKGKLKSLNRNGFFKLNYMYIYDIEIWKVHVLHSSFSLISG